MTGDLLTFICKTRRTDKPDELRQRLAALRADDHEDETSDRYVKFSWEQPTRELANRVAAVCEEFFADPDHFDVAFYE